MLNNVNILTRAYITLGICPMRQRPFDDRDRCQPNGKPHREAVAEDTLDLMGPAASHLGGYKISEMTPKNPLINIEDNES